MTATILPFPGASALLPGALEPPALPERPRRAAPAAPLAPLPLQRPPRLLTSSEQELQDQILEAFFCGFRLAQNHAPKSVARDRAVVMEFLDYVGQPLWACTPEDFASWASQLGLGRHLAPKSQRTMQTAVATFWDYAVDSRAWQNRVHQLSGDRIERIVTRENRVVHTCDNTPVRERAYLTASEFDQFFQMIDLVIEVAALEHPRLLKSFQRDRAMFYTYYAYGLRLSEGWALNLNSFSPNPDLPELGPFGCVGVWGKGTRGSGPRYRTVPAILEDVRAMLDWYLANVRPKFKDTTGNAQAMWLSEQGKRLCRASIAARYKRVIQACGMEPSLFAPHGLRHMHVSHQQTANVPLQFTQHSAGHSSGAVTQTYTHLPSDYMRNIATSIVRGAADLEEDGDD